MKCYQTPAVLIPGLLRATTAERCSCSQDCTVSKASGVCSLALDGKSMPAASVECATLCGTAANPDEVLKESEVWAWLLGVGLCRPGRTVTVCLWVALMMSAMCVPRGLIWSYYLRMNSIRQ